MTRKVLGLTIVVAIGFAVSAEAQTAQRPTRPYRGLFGGGAPPDPNRTRSELTLTASVLGGYDDQIIPGSSLTPVPGGQLGESAYSATGDVLLNYWHGRTQRFFSLDARAFSSAYSYVDVGPSIGANVGMNVAGDVGRRNRVSVRQIFSYEPSLVLGAFSSLESDVNPLALPESGPGNGFLDQRSWSTGSSGSIEHRWTLRQSTTGSASYTRRSYLDEVGYNSTIWSADARHRWNMTRVTSLNVSYVYSDLQVGDVTGLSTPTTTHAIEGAVSYNRRISPTRQVQLSGGAGATQVGTIDLARVPVDYWMPSGHGTVRMDIGRTWALSSDYRRSASALPGVSLETFSTDAASVRTDGMIGSRVGSAFAVSFSNGRSNIGQELGRFRAYSATAQLQIAIARCCAMSTNYDYYNYKLDGITDLPTNLPTQYDRNALRFGFTLWLPLYGSYSGPADGRTGTTTTR